MQIVDPKQDEDLVPVCGTISKPFKSFQNRNREAGPKSRLDAGSLAHHPHDAMKLLRFAEPVWVIGYRTGSVLARCDTAQAAFERLKSEIKLAIVELELPNFAGWDLIRRFTFQKPLKIIATTSAYPESLFEKIKGIGVDAVVPKAIASEVWLKTVEKVLQVNEGTTAETR